MVYEGPESLGIAVGKGVKAWQVDFWDPFATVCFAYWDFHLIWDSASPPAKKSWKFDSTEKDFEFKQNLLYLPESAFPHLYKAGKVLPPRAVLKIRLNNIKDLISGYLKKKKKESPKG